MDLWESAMPPNVRMDGSTAGIGLFEGVDDPPNRRTPGRHAMRILVAYVSKHGATAGIAERIGRSLESAGHQVDVRRVQDVDDGSEYSALMDALPRTCATRPQESPLIAQEQF